MNYTHQITESQIQSTAYEPTFHKYQAMGNDHLSYKISYRHNLPHIQLAGASFFVTFRLAGSLPVTVLRALKAETGEQDQALSAVPDPAERARRRYIAQKQHFDRWDAALDAEPTGPHWLKDQQVAQIVVDSIRYLDSRLYDPDSYCIMSNHFHLLRTPLQDTTGCYYALPRILHSLKGYTAKKANQVLGREGQFWQRESYDHIVRDRDEHLRIRRYILNNPVKVGLVDHWTEWPYSYCMS